MSSSTVFIRVVVGASTTIYKLSTNYLATEGYGIYMYAILHVLSTVYT